MPGRPLSLASELSTNLPMLNFYDFLITAVIMGKLPSRADTVEALWLPPHNARTHAGCMGGGCNQGRRHCVNRHGLVSTSLVASSLAMSMATVEGTWTISSSRAAPAPAPESVPPHRRSASASVPPKWVVEGVHRQACSHHYSSKQQTAEAHSRSICSAAIP